MVSLIDVSTDRGLMSDVAAFLHARLAEAEAINDTALAWVNDEDRWAGRPSDWPSQSGFDVVSTTDAGHDVAAAWCAAPAITAHIVLWDIHRTRWLLRMARAQMTEHAETEGHACGRCVDVVAGRPVPTPWPCPTYRSLTWPWATHEDFYDDWAT